MFVIAIRAAQVFYNLGELNEALSNALGAGKLFDVDEQSEYVQTILGALPPPPPRPLFMSQVP